jgi:hypothetical protein
MRQLRSAKGQQHKANALNANVDISVSQQLALKHRSNDGRGNVVTLAGGQYDKGGQRKVQQGLE